MDRTDLQPSRQTIEPLDDWVLVQPSMDDESRGKLVLPATVAQSRLERSIVLACGPAVTDVAPADVVLTLAAQSIELRDGSRLVQRQYVIARLVD